MPITGCILQPVLVSAVGEACEPIYLDAEARASDLVDLITRRVAQANAIAQLLGAVPPTVEIPDDCMTNASWILCDLLGEIRVYADALHERARPAPS